MTDTIRDLIGQLDAFSKQASALDGIDSMPGSENDKPIPSGATESDPKVDDPTIDNQEHQSTDGAKVDGDVPATNANKYEADEPVLTPDTKALDTADANAKEAADKGNSIVDFILGRKTQKQAAAPAAAPAQKQAPAPAQKQASPDNSITLDMALMAKIAAITLADEEGQFAVQQALTKRAGAEFADEILDALEKRAAEEQAAYEFMKGAQDAEAMIGDLQEAQGAADAEAAMADAGMADAGIPGGDEQALADAASELDNYSADEIVQAVQELAQEGQIPPEQAQAVIEAVSEAAQEEDPAEEVSEDDLAEAIVEAVESGDLTEEDAQALVQAIAEESSAGAEADQALAQDVAAGDMGAADAAAADAGLAAEPETAGEGEKTASARLAKAAAEKRASFKAQLASVLKGR